MSNVRCNSCQLVNWSTAKICERCETSLEGAPAYEYPPLSWQEPSEAFWQIIARAKKSQTRLYEILMEKSEEDFYKFFGEFSQAAADLRDEPFLNYMEGSEDGVEDITLWVISQGKEYYLNILANPEAIPYSADHDINGNEILIYVVADAFEKKFGQSLHLMW